jgi:hypothetical protein
VEEDDGSTVAPILEVQTNLVGSLKCRHNPSIRAKTEWREIRVEDRRVLRPDAIEEIANRYEFELLDSNLFIA